jgi:hypothetical protein
VLQNYRCIQRAALPDRSRYLTESSGSPLSPHLRSYEVIVVPQNAGTLAGDGWARRKGREI